MAKKTIKEDIIWAYALKNALEHNGQARAGSVFPGLFAAGLEKSEVKTIMPKVNEILKEVNDMGESLQKIRFSDVEKYVGAREERAQDELPELPGAKKGKVVMRFRPAPSGPLHVGHLISNMISSLFVKEYGGKFYVIIDDTNPEETLEKAYKQHKIDCDWVFGNVTKYFNASDRIELYYKYAEKFIKKQSAYVCTCDPEGFKELVTKQVACPCRNLMKREPNEAMKRWKKMLNKGKDGYKQGEAVLRFKADLKNPNPAMRDFPLARINESPHPKQGKKYRVWPLMNLSVTVDDLELGITHAIRGKDHMDNAKRQAMMFEVLNKKPPWNFFIGRMKFTDMELSKRKIAAMIELGKYTGWDDPRLPTIAGLKKKGYKPEAFAKLATQRGLIDVDKVISKKDFFKVLDGFNSEK